MPEDSFPEGQLVKMGKKAIQLLGVQDQVREKLYHRTRGGNMFLPAAVRPKGHGVIAVVVAVAVAAAAAVVVVVVAELFLI